MGKLVLVRHGQASFGAADYDQLSPTGEAQARALGRWWAERGVRFGQLYVGPRKRHHQTLRAAAEGYTQAGGEPWPAATELDELDEYDAQELFYKGLPLMLERQPALQDELSRYQQGGPDAGRSFQRVLEALGSAWASGDLDATGVRPLTHFRQSVERGVKTMIDRSTSGAQIVAFSSGGPLAAAAGMALDLDHHKTLELSYQIFNAARVSFMFSRTRARLTLHTFNTTDHLTELTLR